MNSIKKQNEKKAIRLLAAQRAIYSHAKKYWALTLLLNIIVVPVFSFATIFKPQFASHIAILGIAVIAINAALYLIIKNYIKTAASIQELFDHHVLEIPLNVIIVNKPDIKEVIEEWADKLLNKKTFLKKNKDPRLKNWYTISPRWEQSKAIITAQRINSWWDGSLRTKYTITTTALVIVIFFVLIYVGNMRDLKLKEFILVIIVPMIPAFQTMIVECYKNFQAIKNAEANLNRSKSLLAASETQQVDMADIRALQDAIYSHRITAPLIFDFVYWISRKKNELLMNKIGKAK